MGRRCSLPGPGYHLHHHRACHPSHWQGKFVSIRMHILHTTNIYIYMLYISIKTSQHPLGANNISESHVAVVEEASQAGTLRGSREDEIRYVVMRLPF